MFGYLITDGMTLSKESKRQYGRFYCGLCSALYKKYGKGARLVLNYDCTFLFVFLSALADTPEKENIRCPLRPLRCRECISGKIAEYTADVNILLAYLNALDDVKDENSLKARIFIKLFDKKYAKAEKANPVLSEKIKSHLDLLSECEKDGVADPFVPADIFGNLLSDLFSYNEKAEKFGYFLGRFIYLCDAVCDFKSDLKHGRYNPLTAVRMSEFYGILNSEAEKCIEEKAKLGITEYNEIIENVLTDGMWINYRLKYSRKGKQ